MSDEIHIILNDLNVLVQAMLNRLQEPPAADCERTTPRVLAGDVTALLEPVREILGDDPITRSLVSRIDILIFLGRPAEALLTLQTLLATDRARLRDHHGPALSSRVKRKPSHF